MFGGHQNFGIPSAQSLIDGLGTKSGKKGAKDTRVFKNSQCRDIQFGYSPCQNTDRIAPADAESFEDIGEAVALPFQLAIGESAGCAFAAKPMQGHVVAKTSIGMTIDRFVSDIEPFPPWKTLQLTADGIPGKGGKGVGIIQEIWSLLK